MHQLLNGQIVDDQTHNELQELQEVEAVEKEVSKLVYDKTQKEWESILSMSAQDFINQIKL